MWDKLNDTLPLFPPAASTIAGEVDLLYFFLVAVAGFFSILIFTLIFVFMIKYRRRGDDERPAEIHGSMLLEIAWSAIPLVIVMIMFGWGSWLFIKNYKPPENAMDVHVVAKQWMWKLRHPEGKREINELHVPVGQPVRLIMTSEDVIHSFYVPAFRVKKDVLPGRYTTLWFEATEVGEYHLFCAEYCGTEHSYMGGSVFVMEPADYERWLRSGERESMESTGERLFSELRCDTCHSPDGVGRGPSLERVFDSRVLLKNDERLIADEAYVRESILDPTTKVVMGYRPVMPTFQGQVSEEQILELISYIKSLGGGERRRPRQ